LASQHFNKASLDRQKFHQGFGWLAKASV